MMIQNCSLDSLETNDVFEDTFSKTVCHYLFLTLAKFW